MRRHEGVSDGRWKLIRFYGSDVPNGEEWELFDLKTDPNEMNSIYSHPESSDMVRRLKKKLKALKRQYAVPETDEV